MEAAETYLRGTRELALAFGTMPLKAAHYLDAEVCTWTSAVSQYDHVEVPDMLIGILTTGDVKWVARNGRKEGLCRRGKVSVIPAGTRVRMEASAPLAATTVHISPQRINRFMGTDDGAERLERANFRMGMNEPLIIAALLALHREMRSQTSASGLFINSLVDVLICQALNEDIEPDTSRSGSGLSPHMLRRVTDYIATELCSPLSLQELAALTGMSEYHFCKTFKRSTGITPHKYVMQVRIDRAKDLLAKNMSITEIALNVGFSSHSHFSGAFHRVTGLSPTVYRRHILYY